MIPGLLHHTRSWSAKMQTESSFQPTNICGFFIQLWSMKQIFSGVLFSQFLAGHLYCVAWLPVLPCSYIQHSNSSLFGYTHKSVCHLSYIRMPMMHWITIYVTMLYQTTMHLKSLCSIQRAGNKWTATIITDRRPLVFQHESWARSSA